MGCSVGTVKSTTSRALEGLRNVIELPTASTAPAVPTNGNGTTAATGRSAADALHLNAQKDTCVITQDLRSNEGSITS